MEMSQPQPQVQPRQVESWNPVQPLKRRVSPLVWLLTFMLGVAALYWGRPILIPLTVAILLTFLLNPVVSALYRWGLPRALAVILVVFCLFSVVGAVAYALGSQVSGLAAELPQYKDNIIRKISQFRTAGRGRVLERLDRTFREIVGEIQRQDGIAEEKGLNGALAGGASKANEKPVPVVVQGGKNSAQLLPWALGSVAGGLVTAVLVVVLVVFMLLRLQELRNRLMRLVGYGRLTTTTKALDDAADRISRYLLMQSMINATYGCCIGLGLYFIGLPYAILLGAIAGSMRFVPYVGPAIGALLPLALSFALFDAWTHTLLVVGLFAGLEAVTSMVLEPLLYGQSAGVSEVALLVAIAFWTWIWGSIGLALATPLTVCLVVLCKYIPELEFFEALLGDDPVGNSPLIYYQRLLARDTDEATEIAQKFLEEHPAEQIYDQLFLPALRWAKRDVLREKLDQEDQRWILQTTRELIEDLDELQPAPAPAPLIESAPGPASTRIRILGCPSRDLADELGLQMLGRILDPKRFELDVLSSEKLFSEMIAAVREKGPDVVCVGALTPDPIAPARHFCKRLRDCFPKLRIFVCRWGQKEPETGTQDPFLLAGADFSGATLLETRNHLLGLFPVLAQAEGSTQALQEPVIRSETVSAA
jgi:predicted PurR-regulated permease PerM